MSDELDPEVIADLQLRACSERDRTRGSETPIWTAPKIFGQWRCRTPGCGALVDVTEECFERWSIFNRELRRRAEAPLDPNLIVLCDGCQGMHDAAMADRRRKEVDRMAFVIRELKAGADPMRVAWNGETHTLSTSEAYEKLRKWGHPDVEALRQAIAEKKAGPARSKRGGL